MGIIKVLTQLFSTIGKGPISRGIGDIFGAGANLINGIANGCKSQAKCSSIVEQPGCEKQSSCSWNPPKDGADVGKCLANTGQKEGSGGFFSARCGLGISAILAFSAFIFSGLVTIIAAALTRNANIETAGRLNGKGTAETLKGVVNETIATTESIEATNDKDVKEGKEGARELTEQDIENISSRVANKISTQRAVESTVGQKNATELANQAVESARIVDAHIIERADKELDLNKQNQEKNEDLVDNEMERDNHVDPIPGRNIKYSLDPLIRHFEVHDITPTPEVHLYFMNRTMKKENRGQIIHPNHVNYLKNLCIYII